MKKALALGSLVFALTGASRIASACSVWYQDLYDDATTVWSNMTVMQQTYGDSIRAYEQLASPDNRYTSQDTGDRIIDEVVAWADLPDGSYSAYGEAYENDIQEGTQNQQHTISPFLEITQTNLSPTTLGQQNGAATFTVNTVASPNCKGTGVVNAAISYPNGMKITISDPPSPDGDGVPQPSTASGHYNYGSNNVWTQIFTYPIATGIDNTVTGSGNATAYVYATPAGCNAVTLTGVTLVQQLTVN